MSTRGELGAAGEELAAALLCAEGLVILERNVRVPGGEIDIVAKDGPVTVFVEVRTRRGLPGDAAASVGFRKRRRMRRCALQYCQERGLPPSLARLDVVAIDLPRNPRGEPRTRHYRGVGVSE